MTTKIERLLEERGSTYGPPEVNLACSRRLRQVYSHFEKGNPNSISHAAHAEAVEMVLFKIGRIATGQFCPDNYNDIIGYITIAKNIAMDNPTPETTEE